MWIYEFVAAEFIFGCHDCCLMQEVSASLTGRRSTNIGIRCVISDFYVVKYCLMRRGEELFMTVYDGWDGRQVASSEILLSE